jgi:hypothetical protein
MAEKKKPDYDIQIPFYVLHDNSISPNARLIYGEIVYLCGKDNCCLFDDSLFSELYGVSKRTLDTWIKTLIDSKYITVEHIPANKEPKSKKIKITLTDKPVNNTVN